MLAASAPLATALSPSGIACLTPAVATAARSKIYWQILGITPRCAPLPTPAPKTGDSFSAVGGNPSVASPLPFSVSWALLDAFSRSVARDDEDGDDGGDADCGDIGEIGADDDVGIPGAAREVPDVEGVALATATGVAEGSAPPIIVNVFPEPVWP